MSMGSHSHAWLVGSNLRAKHIVRTTARDAVQTYEPCAGRLGSLKLKLQTMMHLQLNPQMDQLEDLQDFCLVGQRISVGPRIYNLEIRNRPTPPATCYCYPHLKQQTLPDASTGTTAWLKDLQKNDPEQYKVVFKQFREENAGAARGGRGKKKHSRVHATRKRQATRSTTNCMQTLRR